jgi:putative transposase
MCRILEVAASGFYAWIQKPLSDRSIEDERLLALIRESYSASGGIYGSPRVFGDLREAGERIGRKRVARIMRTHRIRAIRGYKKPRNVVSLPSTLAPNRLQRQFTVAWPDHAWVTVVMDLYSRMIIGWSMQPTLARDLVLDALLMAVWRRKPRQTVIVHSDQGSQYGSDDWIRFCKAHKLDPSMSRRGNCWDNAVAESFFSSLKKERIRKKVYRTRSLAKSDIFEYIEMFYNRTRRHSHLGGISPEAFEAASSSGL